MIIQNHKDFTPEEQKNYNQLCAKKIADYVQTKTGFTEVSIEKISSRVETFAAEIEYTISGGSTREISPGRKPSSQYATLVSDEEELNMQVDFQLKNDLNDAILRIKIGDFLKNCTYGQITDDINIYKNPNTYLLYRHCDKCNGTGTIRCWHCNGERTVSCSNCHGKGTIKRYSNNTEYSETCTRCHGDGKITCSTCSGTGRLSCEKCKASSYLTYTIRTYLKVSSKYSMKYLKSSSENFTKLMSSLSSKIDAKDIIDYCDVSLNDTYSDDDDVFIARYVCRMPIAEAEVKIQGNISNWVLFASNPTVLDAGGAIDHVMNSRISNLNNCQISFSNPYSDAENRISEFLDYEINADILKENTEEDNIEIIRKNLNNSVSNEYIANAINAIAEICKNVVTVNEKFLRIVFTVLPALIASFFINTKSRDGWEFTIFLVFTPILVFSITKLLLSRWYRLHNKDIFRAWCKKRGFIAGRLDEIHTYNTLSIGMLIFIISIITISSFSSETNETNTIAMKKTERSSETVSSEDNYRNAITPTKKNVEKYSDISFKEISTDFLKSEANERNTIVTKKAERYSKTVTVFDNHKDIDTQINQIMENRYNEAIALKNSGRYSEAIIAFQKLNNYKNSVAQIEELKQLLLRDVKVGNTVFFGKYEQDNDMSNGKENIEWFVLAKENHRALLISKYCLDYQRYHKEHLNTSWENCTLRHWLNNEFINTAFTENERAKIPTVIINTDKKPSSTQDKIFLLSITEVQKYFVSFLTPLCKTTDYAKSKGIWTKYNTHNFWWLRSNGNDDYLAAFVDFNGTIHADGYFVSYDRGGVRPALWINLHDMEIAILSVFPKIIEASYIDKMNVQKLF